MAQSFFQKTAEHIKSFGYRVFVKDAEDYRYGFFSDGKRIGYFQTGSGGIVNLSTFNDRVGSECTSYAVRPDPDGFVGLDDVNRENLEEALRDYPSWVGPENRMKVVKYRDLEDFLARYWNSDNLKEI